MYRIKGLPESYFKYKENQKEIKELIKKKKNRYWERFSNKKDHDFRYLG